MPAAPASSKQQQKKQQQQQPHRSAVSQSSKRHLYILDRTFTCVPGPSTRPPRSVAQRRQQLPQQTARQQQQSSSSQSQQQPKRSASNHQQQPLTAVSVSVSVSRVLHSHLVHSAASVPSHSARCQPRQIPPTFLPLPTWGPFRRQPPSSSLPQQWHESKPTDRERRPSRAAAGRGQQASK